MKNDRTRWCLTTQLNAVHAFTHLSVHWKLKYLDNHAGDVLVLHWRGFTWSAVVYCQILRNSTTLVVVKWACVNSAFLQAACQLHTLSKLAMCVVSCCVIKPHIRLFYCDQSKAHLFDNHVVSINIFDHPHLSDGWLFSPKNEAGLRLQQLQEGLTPTQPSQRSEGKSAPGPQSAPTLGPDYLLLWEVCRSSFQ